MFNLKSRDFLAGPLSMVLILEGCPLRCAMLEWQRLMLTSFPNYDICSDLALGFHWLFSNRTFCLFFILVLWPVQLGFPTHSGCRLCLAVMLTWTNKKLRLWAMFSRLKLVLTISDLLQNSPTPNRVCKSSFQMRGAMAHLKWPHYAFLCFVYSVTMMNYKIKLWLNIWMLKKSKLNSTEKHLTYR